MELVHSFYLSPFLSLLNWGLFTWLIMLKALIPFILIIAQIPAALAYTDFKEEGKVMLFGFPPKAKLKIIYGDLKYFTSIKFAVDKCSTITLKSNRLGPRGLFRDAEDFIIEGDDKTSKIVNIKKSDLAAQQASINWDTIESNQYKYTCLGGVINSKIPWIERDGLKFFKYGGPRTLGEKLYITGISYSTVKLKTPQERNAKPVTRNVSSDKCGAVTIRDNQQYPNNLLGRFKVDEKTGSYPQSRNYDMALIPEITGRDSIKCDRYQR